MLALAGPTAAGKSALAHAAARALGAEIVVADPFQRYRGLEIAADSPRPPALAEVRHHCVGDLDLTDRSTAAGFARRAHAAIDACAAAGRPAVVSGGTGLYLRAALADLGFPAQSRASGGWPRTTQMRRSRPCGRATPPPPRPSTPPTRAGWRGPCRWPPAGAGAARRSGRHRRAVRPWWSR